MDPEKKNPIFQDKDVVVVYHANIVAMNMSRWKKFWPIVIDCVLRPAGSYLIWNYADLLTTQLLPRPDQIRIHILTMPLYQAYQCWGTFFGPE